MSTNHEGSNSPAEVIGRAIVSEHAEEGGFDFGEDCGEVGGFAAEVEPADHLYGLSEERAVVFRERPVADRVCRVFVAVVFVVVYFDGGVVAQFVGPHHLDVGLHGAHGHSLGDPLHIVEGLGACFDEVVECPSSVFVSQASVDGLVSDQCVFVCGHGVWKFLILNSQFVIVVPCREHQR